MTRQKVQGVVLAAAVAAAAVACTNTSTAEGPQPTVVDSLPPPGTDDDAASPSPDEDAESPAASSTAETDASDANDDESDVEPDEDPTPIPASSDGPAQNWPVPEPPEEIYEPTEEGAEALIQYFYEARHYARTSGDTEPLEEVSVEECALCEAEIEIVVELFSRDGWYVSDKDELVNWRLRMESDVSATGVYALQEASFQTFMEMEYVSTTETDTVEAFEFAAMFNGDRWQVLDITYIGEYDPSWDERTPEPSNGDQG